MSNQASWNMARKYKNLVDGLAKVDLNADPVFTLTNFKRRAMELGNEMSEAHRDEGGWECGECTATFATADERDNHSDRKHLHERYSRAMGRRGTL